MSSAELTMDTKLPDGWSVTPVVQIGKTTTGNTPPTKNKENYGSYLPYAKPPHLINRSIRSSDTFLSEEGAAIARVLPPLSTLVTCIGNLGRTAINKTAVAFNQQINAITPFEGIDPYYIFYQAQSPNFRNQLESKASATTISIVNKGSFDTILLNIAPLNEQKRIVAKIEELFSELDAGEQSLRDARQQLTLYRQSLLKQAFEGKLTETWRDNNPDKLEASSLFLQLQSEIVNRPKPRSKAPNKEINNTRFFDSIPPTWLDTKLGDIVSIERGRFSVRPRNDPRYYGGDVPFVQIGDLPREGGKIESFKQTLNAEGLKVSKLFPKGTPLIAIVGATIGNTGILNFDSCCPDSLVAFITLHKNLDSYIDLFFRANKEAVRAHSYSSGGQPNINNAYLQSIHLPLCSLPEQQEIVKILDEQFTAIEQNEKEIDHALTQSQALRQSILKKAFTGKLI